MRIIPSLTLITILTFLMVGCSESKKTFTIPKGHVGMFGYGCLMSKNFIETSLLDKAYNGPYLKAHLKDYQRSWTFSWPSTIPFPNADGNYYKDYILVKGDTIYPQNLLYLNIKESKGTTVNGVLYIVPEIDLPTYDELELGYERIDVTNSIEDYTIEGGTVFAYKARSDFEIEPSNDYNRNIIELSYFKVITESFNYWGKDFEEEYNNSTLPIDTSIVRENKKVLWVNPPLEKTIELKSSFKYLIQ